MATLQDVISINARRYPSPHEGDGEPGFVLLVVLKKMHGNFVRAYAGIVRDTSREDGLDYVDRHAVWVMEWGNKLRFEEAKTHFPIGLAAENYYD